MKASFDQSSAMAPHFGAAAWKDGKLIAVEKFGSDVKEPIWERFNDIVFQVVEWLYFLEKKHGDFFTEFAFESFVDYKKSYKNRSLAQLDQFTGYLARSLEMFSDFSTIEPVCKGDLSKDHAYAIAKPVIRKWGKDVTDDEADAIFHGILAGFNKK